VAVPAPVYRAPSWSWASVEGEVSARMTCLISRTIAPLASVVNVDLQLKGANPFGEVVGGRMIKAPKVRLHLSAEPDDAERKCPEYPGLVRMTMAGGDAHREYVVFDLLDTTRPEVVEEGHMGIYALVVFKYQPIDDQPFMYDGLMITPAEGENTYRRVRIFEFEREISRAMRL